MLPSFCMFLIFLRVYVCKYFLCVLCCIFFFTCDEGTSLNIDIVCWFIFLVGGTSLQKKGGVRVFRFFLSFCWSDVGLSRPINHVFLINTVTNLFSSNYLVTACFSALLLSACLWVMSKERQTSQNIGLDALIDI